MKYKWFFKAFLLIMCMMILFSGCKTESAEKKLVVGYNSWLRYTFEEACDEADRIVIGTLKSIDRTFTDRISDKPRSDGSYAEMGLTVFIMEVETTLKGEHKDTIEYIQRGAETKDCIYRYDDGAYECQVGERIIVFLDSHGAFFSPSFLRTVDSDGNIQTGYYPANYTAPASAENDPYTIPVSDYAALITNYLAK